MLTILRIARAMLCGLLCLFSFQAHGQVASTDSGISTYFVGFKAPAPGEQPFIWPGIRIEDRPDQTPVPFGEHSSGQSKAEVAAALGLVGELVGILDSINAIVVRVDAAEAERLSQLSIVDYVQRSGTTIIGSAQPEVDGEHATYLYGVLTIPRVDTTEQVGQYQDAKLSLQADGSWKLDELRAFGNSGLAKVPIESVEVVKTDGFPMGVYLRTIGWASPCGYQGKARVQQRQTGTHFDIALSVPVLVSDEPYACTANVEYVRLTIPLEVYGLAAGTYTYSVNGVSGSFSLSSDNKYADDCSASSVQPTFTVSWCPQ
jgi:hypothetical protein